MKKAMMLSFLPIFLLLAACGSSGEETGNDEETTRKVYTTVYPLKYITEEIAGEKLDVESILPSGSDAHTYEPTTKEMVAMAEGEAFFYTKDEFEPYASTIAGTLDEEDVPTIAVAEGLEAARDEGHGHEGHNHSASGEDPHVWLDPALMSEMADVIREELSSMYPEEKKAFVENTVALKEELKELDQRMGQTIREADTKEVVVSHAAYGYWENAYGLEQISISGLSSTNEPSQKELEHVIETAENHGLGYVLFEKNVSPKAAEVVQEELGAEALYLHNLATRTEEEIEEGKDYIDLMEQNIEVLEKALNKEDPA